MKKKESKPRTPRPESDKTYSGRQRKVSTRGNDENSTSAPRNRKSPGSSFKKADADSEHRPKTARSSSPSSETKSGYSKGTDPKSFSGKFSSDGPKRKPATNFKKSYSSSDKPKEWREKSPRASSTKRKESSDTGFRKDNKKGRTYTSEGSGFKKSFEPFKSERKKSTDSGFDKPFKKTFSEEKPARRTSLKPKSGSDEGFRDDKRRPFKTDGDFKDSKTRPEKSNFGKPAEEKFFKSRDDSKSSFDKPKRTRSGDTGIKTGRRGRETKRDESCDIIKKTETARVPRKFSVDNEEVKSAPTYKSATREIKKAATSTQAETDEIRLNRFIANAGVCSRREADELITQGLIKVNNKIVTEMGFKVKPVDVIKYNNKVLKQEKFVYVLLNKPKDFITTTEDPEARKTVMELVKNACEERIYPVGRLDRNTTGLLLFTNDGDLADKLSHPSNKIRKVYQVELNKPITDEDYEKITNGVELEDGKATIDELAIVTPDAMVIGIEIHLGRNRIVRRIFESLGYDVLKLDRVTYASLTKKDLPRGNWRYLTEKEVINLKHFTR